MKITSYSFGRLVINGKTYTSDVVIYPGRVDSSWWREEGHRLQPADLTAVINARPDVIVIGTGASGVLAVPEETSSVITSKGIEVRIARTGKAAEIFNSLQGKKIVIAALHLTC